MHANFLLVDKVYNFIFYMKCFYVKCIEVLFIKMLFQIIIRKLNCFSLFIEYDFFMSKINQIVLSFNMGQTTIYKYIISQY